MPFFGIGLHIIIALFFAIHAVRNGRPMYWLFVLFSFPLLGSIVYFFAEYMPSSTLDRNLNKASNLAANLIDPSRELRESKQAFELAPTIQNRMRLAKALDGAGQYSEAAEQFDACLNGPFASDPEIGFSAAQAKLHNNQATQAIELITAIRDKTPDFRHEQISILLAQSYANIGNHTQARAEFISAMEKHGTAEALGQYALWAISIGEIETAKQLRSEMQKMWQHWNKHSKNLHKPLFKQIDNALEVTQKNN